MNPMLALRQYQKIGAQAQTSEASPHRLVQMLMQGGLDRIAQAKGAMERNDIPNKGILIGKAIGIVGGLLEGLDLDNQSDSVGELANLYEYMMKRLTEANAKTDPKILDEVADLLRTVKEGWDAIGTPAPQF
ncbi:flagellar export chaperone FliS [Pseudomonas mohnii]|uniref:flagellar export chaperone FliS n=1 Tax=Pseudomonas mohnii TaxID=395600 RepID=UPI0018DBC9C3|nr:flagellar export chaperone FliS [Pseudomonas mohnii]MBH8612772.1 flagellar export chaperone FliS [Pseudomonas mohnii]